MTLVTLANGTRFGCEPGMTVLDAAEARGVVLEHSCRTGRCGACKARLSTGTASLLRDASALSANELRDGWILTCAHEAQSDLQLDIEDLGALAGISLKTLPARIDRLERLAPDVLQIDLRLPPNAGFRFLAGQYIDVTGHQGVKRSYSLSSDAQAPDRLQLQVRQVDGGELSGYWFERAQANDLLRFQGPRGTFFLRSVSGLHLVFLATGTGIAPIKSMLLELARLSADARPASVSVYWGGRVPADLYWDPRQALPALHYVPVLSRADDSWAGARGHVQDVMLTRHAALDDSVVYACGSESMTQAARAALLAAGLPPKRFFSDAFVSST